MIHIKNLCKEFQGVQALNRINLDLPKKGLYVIKGPSGCGKTTLLNCISGLIDFDGSITIDNYQIGNNETNNDEFRLKNIGLVFQDYKLFENETVVENIIFPLDTVNNLDEEQRNIKINEILKLVGLENKKKQFVSTLSGGEKQRVCLARSLINDPKVVLADEPTGALDSKNGKQVMDILSKISVKSLVILVTHDEILAKEYGDKVIQMQDGKIISIIDNHHSNRLIDMPLLRNGETNKKPSIPLLFLFKHSIHSMKKKRIRSFICTSVTSIGLIGVGLSVSMSSIVSNNVKQAYSSLIKKDQIVISNKDKSSNIYKEFAGSFIEATDIAKRYTNYIEDIGVLYQADFENIFLDSNELCINGTGQKSVIKGISARNINEFEWLDLVDKEFYPKKIDSLKDDEIFMGLTMNTIREICYSLRIERSIESLSNYIKYNDLSLVFNFEHFDWQYEDQQILTLRGFSLENELKIYHTDHLWNQYMFEERMRFPTSDSLSEEDYYPWTFKKTPYLYCKDNIDEFLTFALVNEEFENYTLELANNRHLPLLYKNVETKEVRRVLFLSNNINSIPLRYLEYFKQHSKELIDPILGSQTGIVIYPESLMMGFSEKAFLSFDIDKINEAIDLETKIDSDFNQTVAYPKEIITGHFTNQFQKGLSFNIQNNKEIRGQSSESLDEIVVSSSIMDLYKEAEIGSTIYFSFPYKVIDATNNIKEYKTIPLTITGVINSNEFCIYHDELWPVRFFQSRIGLSMLNLKTQAISYSTEKSKSIDESIKRLKRAFPKYDIINPLNDINESIDEVSKYISIVALIFSLFASITSILLLSICSYLHVFESRKEIGLARSIGINKKEANKFVYGHSITLCGISFLLSSIELSMISLIISYELTGTISFSVPIYSFLIMFLLAILIALINGKIISSSISKKRIIEITKY